MRKRYRRSPPLRSANPNLFSPSQTLEDAIAKLRSIRGIGEWTAQYIAMRVLREPDAFPAADIGLLRALTRSEERPAHHRRGDCKGGRLAAVESLCGPASLDRRRSNSPSKLTHQL